MQRISNPDSKKYLRGRQEYILERSSNLSNTEKIVSDIVTVERSKPIRYESMVNNEECLEMRQKLKDLREKVKKAKPVKFEYTNNNYPRHDFTVRRSSADNSYLMPKRLVVTQDKKKDKEHKRIGTCIPQKHSRKVKRVPPPNFMIGMRDLARVYESNDNSFVLTNRSKD